jgi:uncharacterized repeat protein (TIGR02543 family)
MAIFSHLFIKENIDMRMKKIGTQTVALIAALAVLALALVACDDSPGSGTPTMYKVTFDANEGTVDGGATKVVEVQSGKTITPPTPTHSTLVSLGWYPSKTTPFGNQFTKDTPVTKDITVFARWGTTQQTPYTVTFNANGGTFIGGGTTRVFQVYQDEFVSPLPELATRSGYTFNGWKTDSGNTFTATTPVTAVTVVSAQWTATGPGPVTPGNGSFNGKINNADVYEMVWDEDDDYPEFKKVTGTAFDGSYAYTDMYDDDNDEYVLIPLSEVLSSATTVTITNGKLTVNLGDPKQQYLESVTGMLGDEDTLTVSNPNAKSYMLSGFINQAGDVGLGYGGLDNQILLCYVNSNVTITGSVVSTDDYGSTYTDTYALNLRTGWNYIKATSDNEGRNTVIQTATPGNNSMWVIRSYGKGDDPSLPPTPLANGQWANGTFTGEYEQHSYSFPVTAGTTYYVWWNDSFEGNDTKTADIMVSAYYYDNWDWIFAEDSAWDNPQEFTAEYNGTVYLMVQEYNGDIGDYAIAYRSGSSTRP